MSRYHGNDQRCEGCGLRYGDFRTGLTYRDVWIMLWMNDDDPATWQYKRRHTILGRWHAMKKEMWAFHKHECEVPF